MDCHQNLMPNIVVKGLVHEFWHDNARPCSNIRDLLKCCSGPRYHEPGIKHYLDMTPTQLYEMFKASHPKLSLGQRYFEK